MSKKEKEEEIYEELDEEEAQRDISDMFDIVASFQEVNGKTEWDLDENYTKSTYSEEEKPFISRQHELALLVWAIIMGEERYNTTPNELVKKNALRGYSIMMSLPKDIAILNRNSKRNPFLIGILDKLSKTEVNNLDDEKGIVAKGKKMLAAFVREKKEEPEE